MSLILRTNSNVIFLGINAGQIYSRLFA